MKTLFRILFSIAFNTLVLPCLILSTVCLTWYLLPAVVDTEAGQFILSLVNQDQIMIITIVIASFTLGIIILGKILTLIKNSKILNFQTHIITWLLAFIMITETAYVFLSSEQIQTMIIDFNHTRKLGVSATIIFMFIYMVLTPKVKVIVNRRIQAYDTAKELNMKARSSSVFIHFLKTIDFLCPELLLLILLCFVFSIDVSMYFVYLLIALVMPIIGNVICDKRVKKEYDRKIKENQKETAKEVIKHLTGKGNE